jgi:hypothetical protein
MRLEQRISIEPGAVGGQVSSNLGEGIEHILKIKAI